MIKNSYKPKKSTQSTLSKASNQVAKSNNVIIVKKTTINNDKDEQKSKQISQTNSNSTLIKPQNKALITKNNNNNNSNTKGVMTNQPKAIANNVLINQNFNDEKIQEIQQVKNVENIQEKIETIKIEYEPISQVDQNSTRSEASTCVTEIIQSNDEKLIDDKKVNETQNGMDTINTTQIISELDSVSHKTSEKCDEKLESLKEANRICDGTINSLDRTIADINRTLRDISDFNAKYQKFKDDFSNVMTQFAERISYSIGASGGVSQSNTPAKEIDIASAVELIADKHRVLWLTGAGISVESNIPTFRGDNGFWTVRDQGNEIKAQEYLTYKYFKEHPEEIWDFHHKLKELVKQNKPGPSHNTIADLQCFYEKLKDKRMTLVTQNIDNFHVDAYYNMKTKLAEEVQKPNPSDSTFGFLSSLYEIHGNILYMRCDKECTERLYLTPEKIKIPQCPKCNELARPHTLFFDESYKEAYYRSQTVLNAKHTMDALIVVGTALETNLAAGIVMDGKKKGIPVIEINPKPIINGENVYKISEKSKDILPEFCKLLKDKITQQN